jgi:hypothetical protein
MVKRSSSHPPTSARKTRISPNNGAVSRTASRISDASFVRASEMVGQLCLAKTQPDAIFTIHLLGVFLHPDLPFRRMFQLPDRRDLL